MDEDGQGEGCQQGYREAPVVEAQREDDQDHADQGGEELRDGMREGMLQLCIVRHDRRGQVGEVVPPEEGQR